MSILWGKGKDLDYWTALQAGDVSEPEKRAISLLASISDEKRFSFYCMAGMFPAMGNVTKRIYMIRRWTTVLELEDGAPRTSWCILAADRQIAPETDHVVAMKNILEGNEMAFREIGNAFHHAYDPNRGRVEAKTAFPNPYLNQIGPELPKKAPQDPSGWNEDAALEFRNREGWVKAMALKGEIQRNLALEKADPKVARAAAWRHKFARQVFCERAKDWARIPEKKKAKLPETEFERLSGRLMRYAQGMTTNNAGTITADTSTNGISINNSIFWSDASTAPNYFNVAPA